MKLTINKLTQYLNMNNPSEEQVGLLTISIDTRQITPANPAIYFAIVGERLDGHAFIDQAISNGAEVLVVNNGYEVNGRKGLFLFVEDTQKALGQVAAGIRRDSKIPWVGVTGSAGKTTTRRFISDLLSIKGPVLETIANNNNQIGVPLTIFNLEENHQFAVIEAGTNHCGEIDYLANIIKPDIAVITNIGPTHIEFLGSVEGVAKEKSSLFVHLKPDGKAIFNIETRCVDFVKNIAGKRLISYGLNSGDVKPEKTMELANSTVLIIDGTTLEIPFKGDHYISNFLAAVVVARQLGLTWDEIARASKGIKTIHGRLDVLLESPIYLIDDSYNASFDSMIAAFQVLNHLPKRGKKIAVLGDMRELGDEKIRYHQELVVQLNKCQFDLVLVSGECWSQVISGYKGKYFIGLNIGEMVLLCNSNIQQSDQILVKASRSLQFDLVAKSIFQSWKDQ